MLIKYDNDNLTALTLNIKVNELHATKLQLYDALYCRSVPNFFTRADVWY